MLTDSWKASCQYNVTGRGAGLTPTPPPPPLSIRGDTLAAAHLGNHPPFDFLQCSSPSWDHILKDSWSSVEKWACHKVYYEPIWWNLHMVSRVLIVSNWRPGQVFIFTSPYWISGPFIVCVNSWFCPMIKSHAISLLVFFFSSWCYSPTETAARARLFIGLTPLFYCLSAFSLKLTTILGIHKRSLYHVIIISSAMLQRHITPCQTWVCKRNFQLVPAEFPETWHKQLGKLTRMYEN